MKLIKLRLYYSLNCCCVRGDGYVNSGDKITSTLAYTYEVFYTAFCTSQVTSFCYSWVLVSIKQDEAVHYTKSFQTSLPPFSFLWNASLSLSLSSLSASCVRFNLFCSQLFYLLAAARLVGLWNQVQTYGKWEVIPISLVKFNFILSSTAVSYLYPAELHSAYVYSPTLFARLTRIYFAL
jgi:hypothetical protein